MEVSMHQYRSTMCLLRHTTMDDVWCQEGYNEDMWGITMCRLNNIDEGYRQRERRNDNDLPVNNNQLDKQEKYHRQKRNDNLPSKQQVSWPREGHNIEDGRGMPKHWVRINWRIIDVPNEEGQILSSEETIVEMRIVWGRSTTITARTTPTTNYWTKMTQIRIRWRWPHILGCDMMMNAFAPSSYVRRRRREEEIVTCLGQLSGQQRRRLQQLEFICILCLIIINI